MPDFFLGLKGELGGQRQSGVFYCAAHASMIIDHVSAGTCDKPYPVVGADVPGLEQLIANRLTAIRDQQRERADARTEMA